MTQSKPSPGAFRVSELAPNTATSFELRPDADRLRSLAADLGVSALRKVSFAGAVRGTGAADWRLDAQLGATIVQPCVVTLEPVSTRIDTRVERLYLDDYSEDDAPEAEIPQDDTIEPLGLWIDPDAVMLEALALMIPLYPRAEDARLGAFVVAEPGVTPMRDEDARPFAGLAALKDQMGAKDDPD